MWRTWSLIFRFIFIRFFSGVENILFLAFYPSDRRSLQPWKENIQHFKTWKFFTFSILLVIRKADPNLGTQINANPQTLFFILFFLVRPAGPVISSLWGDLGVAVGLEQSPVHPHLDPPPPLTFHQQKNHIGVGYFPASWHLSSSSDSYLHSLFFISLPWIL